MGTQTPQKIVFEEPKLYEALYILKFHCVFCNFDSKNKVCLGKLAIYAVVKYIL